MEYKSWWGFLGLCMLIGCIMAGCSKAAPGRPGGFVDSTRMDHDPALPFHSVWRKPGVNWGQYRKLYVAPVNTAYMLEMTAWQEGFRSKKDFEQEVQKLGLYTQDAVKKAFREDPKQRLLVVETPSTAPDVLALEIALTEVVPSKVVLNALGYAPNGIGWGVKAVRMLADDKSSVAFEARLQSPSQREMLATVADREEEQADPVGAKGLTWYGHAYRIIDNWAQQFVKVANRDRAANEVIDDTKPFTLKPW